MEWFSSWLGSLCFICQSRRESQKYFCFSCSAQMAALEQKKPLLVPHQNLTVYALFEYQGFVRDLILSQKKNSKRAVVDWFAKLILQKFRHLIDPASLLVVPGNSFQKNHFIEQVALSLNHHGKENSLIFQTPTLKRKWFRSKSQKQLGRQKRKENSLQSFLIQKINLKDKKFWILDDVVTTGKTIESICELLKKKEARFGAGICLAYTPLSNEAINRFEPDPLDFLALNLQAQTNTL